MDVDNLSSSDTIIYDDTNIEYQNLLEFDSNNQWIEATSRDCLQKIEDNGVYIVNGKTYKDNNKSLDYFDHLPTNPQSNDVNSKNAKSVDNQLQTTNKNAPKNIENTKFIQIKTPNKLDQMLDDLRNYPAIGVSIETTELTYKSRICYISISTEITDYLIDTIELNDFTYKLADIFTNSNVVKIFHSAPYKLKKLQQILNLFVVNIVDIQIAQRFLGNKQSLAAALKKYNLPLHQRPSSCDFGQKPLPQNHKLFARKEVHFLIYIYDNLKKQLIDTNCYKKFMRECNSMSKTIYQDDDNDSFRIALQQLRSVHACQSWILNELDQWRNHMGQINDINSNNVISQDVLLSLALSLPRDQQEVCRLTDSAFLRQHAKELVKISMKGRQHYSIPDNHKLQSNYDLQQNQNRIVRFRKRKSKKKNVKEEN